MAVSISGTSGTWSHGNTVTISGSGFGTKATAAPYLWDTVGNIPSYGSSGVVPVGGAYPWGQNSGDNDACKVQITTSGLRHSRLTKQYVHAPTSANIPPLFGRPGVAMGSAGQFGQYISFYTRSNASWIGSTKIVRFSDNASLGNYQYSHTNQQHYLYDSSAGVYRMNRWTPFGADDGSWYRVEWWLQQSSITMYRNGSVRVSSAIVVNDFPTGTDMTPWPMPVSLRYVYHLGGYELSASADRGPTTWFNEIYLDSTPQRVEIGNASTWAACSVREPSVPSAWSDTAITATVNLGAHPNSGPAYLYVFDSTNTPNTNGYPITLGSGSTVIAPTSDFVGVPTSGQSPLLVNYSDLSSTGDAAPTSWDWNFGTYASPATATTQNTSTTYEYGGSKTVALTVTNSAGTDSETKTAYILARYLKPTNFGAS